MSQYKLPSITTIPELLAEQRAAILDALFEPCTALHTLCIEQLRTKEYPSYHALIIDVGKQMTALSISTSTSDTKWLEEILAAHPRLGAKKVDSAQSQAEQAQLNSGSDGDEAEQLRELNDEYERTFPGLIYVVFVNGRSRAAVMEDMRARIARADIVLERAEAIQAMCDIADDRAKKLS